MKKLLFMFLILSLVLIFSLSVTAEDFNRAARININGIKGEEFIGQAGVLYPFRNNENSLFFTDLRYRISEDNVDEWNIGLGYRYKLDNTENHAAGIYLFKDRRKEYNHYWDMWTVGGEILTDKFDFRLNTYIAENDKVLADDAVVGGSQIKENSNRELVLVLGNEVYYKAMDGLDIEVGKRFTQTDTIFKNVGIYAKLFRFFESDTPTMTGRQLRIDKQFGDLNKINWSIGATWRDDNIRGSETEATFSVSIPFGRGSTVRKTKDLSKAEILEARMTEQPERDLDIVVGKSVSENEAAGETVKIENPVLTDENIKVWYVTEKGSYDGQGTKDDPVNIARIEAVGTGAKAGDIIILSGRDGDILLDFEDTSGITPSDENPIYRINLKESQQLISKRGYALVKTEGREFKYKAEVEQATLVGSPRANGMIIPSKNNVISGINLVNKATVSATIYPSFNGYLNINKNIFEFTADNISEAYAIFLPSSSSEASEINIEQNKFYNKSINSEDNISGLAAVIIDNYNSNLKITITDNEIYDFKTSATSYYYTAAISIDNFYTTDSSSENFIEIVNNTIENSNRGVIFNSYDSTNISAAEIEAIKDYYRNLNTFNNVPETAEVIFGEIYE